MTTAVRQAGKVMSHHLNEIASIFKPGVKLTLLVRVPGHPERTALLSDETDIEEAVTAMRQVRNNPTGEVFDV